MIMASLRVVLIVCLVSGLALAKPPPRKRDVHRQPRGAHHKIVGGSAVRPYSWPFLVQISRGGDSDIQPIWCGGAVISSTFILTAAHCFQGFTTWLDSFRVTASEHDVTTTEGVEQRRKIAKAILHPQYNSNTMEADVALLRLETPLDLSSDNVAIIDMNTDNSCPAADMICEVAGWGDLESGGDEPDVPHEVKVTVVSNEQCSSVYNWYILDSNVCAGEEQGGKDSCQGDSGGPFVCSCGGQERMHVGVVSWGYGCAEAGYPGVYARTSSYVPWINKCVESDGSDCGVTDGGHGGTGGTGGGNGGGEETTPWWWG